LVDRLGLYLLGLATLPLRARVTIYISWYNSVRDGDGKGLSYRHENTVKGVYGLPRLADKG